MALAAKGGIELRGFEEFQRSLRHAVDRELPRRMGRLHKQIGQQVISWLGPDPAAVGQGRGAKVRASASRYSVQLLAGGKHRADRAGPDYPVEQWGVRLGRPVRQAAPPRPFILGAAVDRRSQLLDMYLRGVRDVMRPTFWKVF